MEDSSRPPAAFDDSVPSALPHTDQVMETNPGPGVEPNSHGGGAVRDRETGEEALSHAATPDQVDKSLDASPHGGLVSVPQLDQEATADDLRPASRDASDPLNETSDPDRLETSSLEPTSAVSLADHASPSISVSSSTSSLSAYPPPSAHASQQPAVPLPNSNPLSLRDRPAVLGSSSHSLTAATAIVSSETAVPTLSSVRNVAMAPETSTATTRLDHPVYPNQAFSVLQSQVYPPTYLPHPLRTRSSHPSHYSSYSATTIPKLPPTNLNHTIASGFRTTGHTPASSPGLFNLPGQPPDSAGSSDSQSSPFLHWVQTQGPKETNVADVDIDPISGRKLLNNYEIIDEIGRGVHGKVKLGRNLEKGVEVAIKIVPRYSKRRRLGKLGNPEDKVKKEVAILKKAIHPNVVALLECIDDPAIMKVYLVLEYVELGEIVWRTKGLHEIVLIERRRIERERSGHHDNRHAKDDERALHDAQLARAREDKRKARYQQLSATGAPFWSLEHGGESEDDGNTRSEDISRVDTDASMSSTASRQRSLDSALGHVSSSAGRISDAQHQQMPQPYGLLPLTDEPTHTGAVFEGLSGRTASAAGSFMSHLSSDIHFDPYEEDFSYVPCLTIEQARAAFRDTVLGLEYLHYQGIIHRDIKPANLLWTGDYRVKISDFGVSYLGRPIRDDDNADDVSESDATPLDEAVELAKTVGTPAFYAPELCYTDLTLTRPPVSGQIDLWALGVTLYCLLFARLPFLGEDEFSLFKSIAEDEVFIPRKRLKAVEYDPHITSRSPSHPRAPLATHGDTRKDTDLIYEEIDDDLYDLLRRILEKDPNKRITLKEVKRHPFVLQGISDPVRWIEETDPARQNEGRKIEVSNEDVEKAVVPVGLLERVRSGMRKMGAAIGFGKSREGRRRGRSGAHNPEASTSTASNSPTSTYPEGRRASLRGDEQLSTPTRSVREGDHPLSQSVTASPETADRNPFWDVSVQQSTAPEAPSPRPVALERTISTSAASARTVVASEAIHGRSHSPDLPSPNMPDHPMATEALGSSNIGAIFGGAGKCHMRNSSSGDRRATATVTSEGLRSPFGERMGLLSPDPHAEPSLALSNTVAAGEVEPGLPIKERPLSSNTDPGLLLRPQSSSDQLPLPKLLQSHLTGDADATGLSMTSAAPGRPATAPATKSLRSTGEVLRPLPDSTVDAFTRAQDQMSRRRELEIVQSRERSDSAMQRRSMPGARTSCPPSPDDEIFRKKEQDASYARLTNESGHEPGFDATSAVPPHHMVSSSSDDQMTSGMSQSTSYPSVPSVISAGSSVSADDSIGYHVKPDNYPVVSAAEVIPGPPPFRMIRRPAPAIHSDDEAGYNGDHAVDSEDSADSDDDFLTMGGGKSRRGGSGRSASVSNAQLARRRARRGSRGTMTSNRSGSSGTVKKSLSSEEGERSRQSSRTGS
ncbi:MAG: hypothetical protein M1817_003958 [Caeruleum heppii]|nr:MAG: hypothetical protein M1817_003958 [Caeruleum heppii]